MPSFLLCLLFIVGTPDSLEARTNESVAKFKTVEVQEAQIVVEQQVSPPATPTAAAQPVEAWRPLVESWFPSDQVETALCVMSGESGGDPNADNPRSSAAGLWQFLRSTWDDIVPLEVTGGSYESGAVYDPVASTRAAAWLWANLGWTQWSAYSRCR